MNKITKLLGGSMLIFGLVNLLGSCEISNPEEGVPAIIKIEAVSFSAFQGEGTANQDIKDVWVTVGGEFLGVFPLPAEIPVLQSGERTLFLSFGVLGNGISTTRSLYPFFEDKERTINLVPGEILDLGTVSTNYRDGGEIEILTQTWDTGSNISFSSIQGNSSEITPSADAFEGSSARLLLSSGERIGILASDEPYFNVDDYKKRTFLELNYKCQDTLLIGLAGYNNNGEFLEGSDTYPFGFFPTDEWKKVYINISPEISELTSLNVPYFQVRLGGRLRGNEAESYLYFDNIKVIRER